MSEPTSWTVVLILVLWIPQIIHRFIFFFFFWPKGFLWENFSKTRLMSKFAFQSQENLYVNLTKQLLYFIVFIYLA